MKADAPLRRVLIVTTAFPPLNPQDAQRIRLSLPYYAQNGWEAVVLTVKPTEQLEPVDESLLATLPPGLRLVRCGALSLRLSQKLKIRRLGFRSWAHLFLAGYRILRRERFDLILFSTGQFPTLSLGPVWRALFRIPYIVDLQSPRHLALDKNYPGGKVQPRWKQRLSRACTIFIERLVLKRTAALMSVSEIQLRSLQRRFPLAGLKPSAVVSLGASESDLEIAKKTPSSLLPEAAPGTLRFIHVGEITPSRLASINVLFRSLQRFQLMRPRQARYLRFEFVATCRTPRDQPRPTVKPLADSLGVGDQVIEVAHGVSYLECLRIQSEADALLVLGSSELAHLPREALTGFLVDRPMLAIVFKGSQPETILRELNCAVLASLEDGAPTLPAEDAICDFFSAAVRQFPAHSLPVRNEEVFRQRYSAASLTAQQTALFDLAIHRPARSSSSHGAR